MAKKYQMVRFVGKNPHLIYLIQERQKATRKLRQAEKLFQQDSSAENQEAVEKYTLDLYYTMHFPLTEKYIALYPKTTIESKEVLDKQNRIRQQLKDEMTQRKKNANCDWPSAAFATLRCSILARAGAPSNGPWSATGKWRSNYSKMACARSSTSVRVKKGWLQAWNERAVAQQRQ